jgi:spore maturation protein CgeB
MGIALSDPDVFEPATNKIAANFDVHLTNSEATIPQYRALRVNVHQWPLATYEGFYRPLPPKPEYRCEVLIFGNGYPDESTPGSRFTATIPDPRLRRTLGRLRHCLARPDIRRGAAPHPLVRLHYGGVSAKPPAAAPLSSVIFSTIQPAAH